MKRGVKLSFFMILLGALLLFSSLPAYADTNVYKVRTRVAEAIDYEKSYSSIGTGSSNTQTINGSIGYSYAEKVVIQIYFSDNLAHNGRLTFTNAVSNTLWISDDENVAVIGDTIYFYGKSAFNIYTYKYHYNQSLSSGNLVLDSTADITLGTFTEVTDPNDISGLLNTISTNVSTMVSRLTNIRSYTQSILNDLENATYGLNAFMIELNEIEDYIAARHDWDIPVESFPITWALFYNLGSNYQSIRNYDFWQKYPIFTVAQNTDILSSYSSADGYIDLIIGLNQNITTSTVGNYFSVNNNATMNLVRQIVNFSPSYRFVHLRINTPTTTTYTVSYIGDSSAKLIGIYLGRNDQHIGISQSFMENWFGNEIDQAITDLDDAADDLIDDSDELADDIYDLHQMDVDALDDMNDYLDDISLTDNFGNQSNFVSSASWVRARFNFLTRNNFLVFGDLITFSLTIGLILVLLGKLRS